MSKNFKYQPLYERDPETGKIILLPLPDHLFKRSPVPKKSDKDSGEKNTRKFPNLKPLVISVAQSEDENSSSMVPVKQFKMNTSSNQATLETDQLYTVVHETPHEDGCLYSPGIESGENCDVKDAHLVAATAPMLSSGSRRRTHAFETNPTIRRRIRKRILNKLQQLISEFAVTVGQQAVILAIEPKQPNSEYMVFGAQPLENIIIDLQSVIMNKLQSTLANRRPSPLPTNPELFELPPLIIDGTPTPLDHMSQAQLRSFIPLLLKYATGRGKPGWTRQKSKPPWWPAGLPWANIRMDVRNEEEKRKTPWTQALREIVSNCYKFHGREDLLSTRNSDSDNNFGVFEVDPSYSIINLPEDANSGQLMYCNFLNGATINSDGQITLMAEDGSLSSVIAVPAMASVYQTTVANIDHPVTINNETIFLAPVQSTASGAVPTPMKIESTLSDTSQFVNVMMLKDAQILNAPNIKTEAGSISNQ